MEGGKQRAEDEDYDEDYEMSRMTRTTAVPALEPGQKKSRQIALAASVVEDRGFEPLTFWLPARRSPS